MQKLVLVRPQRSYFGSSKPGTVIVRDNGATEFQGPKKTGRHRYLTMTATQRSRVREALVQLASQPPSQPIKK
jgi:hypothetical protein